MLLSPLINKFFPLISTLPDYHRSRLSLSHPNYFYHFFFSDSIH